jgi:SOS-response transcriptional repressor LexA
MTTTATKTLTPRQRSLLAYITRFVAAHGYPPTYRQMATHFRCNVNNIQGLISRLVKAGAIAMEPGRGRTMRVVEGGDA